MAAAAGITTSSSPANTVVQVQPGMNVQPVVLVDKDGNYVTPSTAATALATTTTPVNVSNATAPTTGQVLTATSGTAATWQAAVTLDATAADIAPVGATVAAGSVGKAADAGHVHVTDNPWRPSDAGFIAWTFDPAACSSSSAPTTGQITLMRVNVRVAASCTGVAIAIATGGGGLVTSQNFLGLYNSAGTQIGVTADQTTAFASAQLLKVPLAGGPFALTVGFYWVAFLGNDTSGTIPALQRGNANIWASNAGLTAAQLRYATNGTGTTLPSTITPASNSGLALDYWAAIY